MMDRYAVDGENRGVDMGRQWREAATRLRARHKREMRRESESHRQVRTVLGPEDAV